MSKVIDRILEAELLKSAQEYPVVTVIGPRQSGKTTLVRKLFPCYQYVNLENPELRNLAQEDPKAFMGRFPTPVILDEIQRVPSLLSWIQTEVDENRNSKGQWILTGSSQLQLRESITQSLAGRTALLTLLPFSMRELRAYGEIPEYEELIHFGFLPRIYDQKIRPTRAWRDYYQTYVERDVRQLIALENQIAFERFLRLLAGRTAQLLNLNSLSNDVGVSSVTLSKWLSVLEASYIVFRLPPYHINFGKRITKSPKIYFLDPGLAAYLLGIETPQQVERDPLVGNLFENMIILEALKSRTNQGKQPNLYFFRDHNQNEVDLLYPAAEGIVPIEIKSAKTFTKSFDRNIRYYQKISNSKIPGKLIYGGETEFSSDILQVTNFRNAFANQQTGK